MLERRKASQAANCRPDRNWCGSVTEAANAVAQTVPTPGIVASRRAISLERCQAKSSRSISRSPRLQIEYLPSQARDHLCRQRRYAGHVASGDAFGETQRVRDPTPYLNAELRQQTADHVHELRALLDEEVPRSDGSSAPPAAHMT